MRIIPAVMLSLLLLLPLPAMAADQGDLMKKIEDLTKELENLKQQVKDVQQKEASTAERVSSAEKKAESTSSTSKAASWLELGGDFRTRYDYLTGKTHDAMTFYGPSYADTYKNDSLLTNRFALNMKARATEDVTVKARLVMYKVWGAEDADSVTGFNSFFADKMSIFDGNVSHTPEDNTLRVDQAFATWSNIGKLPVWFSAGRRPSTGGVPTNLRQNVEKAGSSGVPGLLVDYAFDGAVIGVAPDIEKLPGAYAKLCYGRGFETGFRTDTASMNDVNFLGVNIVPYDTDNLHVELQWDRGFNIFAFPEGSSMTFTNTIMGDLTAANDNLGDIDQYGATVTGKIDKVGPGDLNLFVSGAISKTHPNGNSILGTYGLMWDSMSGEESHSGYGLYLGARYDLPSGTKLGLEYNYGSKYWITFTPASDDLWTSKLGTRGNVYEAYVIQEIKNKAISKYGKAQFRLGYQYYDFKYTGSNNWLGSPTSISDLSAMDMMPQMFPALDKAQDVYLTFDVFF